MRLAVLLKNPIALYAILIVDILELIPPPALEATTVGCLKQTLVFLYLRVEVTDNFNILYRQVFLFATKFIFAEGVGVLFHKDDICLFWRALSSRMYLVWLLELLILLAGGKSELGRGKDLMRFILVCIFLGLIIKGY